MNLPLVTGAATRAAEEGAWLSWRAKSQTLMQPPMDMTTSGELLQLSRETKETGTCKQGRDKGRDQTIDQ